jgi:hypothetical protein
MTAGLFDLDLYAGVDWQTAVDGYYGGTEAAA